LLLYQLAITLIPGVGDINAKRLISYCGSAEAVFKEKKNNLLKIPGMGASTVDSILGQQVLDRAEEEIRFVDENDIQTLYFLDDNYPSRLKHCMDSPIVMYYKGNADLNAKCIVSIVGTRRASNYGKEMCDKLIEELSDLDILIVSGLAYGIDTQAHRSAVDKNIPTVGILAHGLDKIYPYANKKLAEKIVENGGLLTDYMSNTNPDRENFPKRNRIVAGIADAIVVIESAKRGGALITANIANSYSRDVFAVPGRLEDKYSEGCNYLVKTNKAALIQSAKDIKYIMQWEDKKTKGKQIKLFRELSEEESLVLNVLKESGESSIDFIVLKTKLSNTKIASVLLTLEFDGMVYCLPGKIFKAV